jgi:outer membrane protein OmpA-like peptidoglycan-associated protein
MEHRLKTFFLCVLLALAGCAPISQENPPTGNIVGTAIGGVTGAGVAGLLGAPKPVVAVAGIAGAGLGYYLTTLRFASSGIVAAGGKVYMVGDYVIIDIPTDNLFDTNTAEFLPGTETILDSLVRVLTRYNGHNIFISGNTSNFWTDRFSKKISECRAAQVASYLWAHGITNMLTFRKDTNETNDGKQRRLIYIGYGNEFPIANDLRIKGIRSNSRIQIIASPSYATLYWNKGRHKHFKPFKNIGDNTANGDAAANTDYSKYAYAFSDDHAPDGAVPLDPQTQPGRAGGYTPPTEEYKNMHPVETYSEAGNHYNNVVNDPQTTPAVMPAKHAGYKDEPFPS